MISSLLPHLYYFYTVASEQSFTAAAVKLRISQSAVSLQIARLEEKLGVDLFHREGRRSITLTQAGGQLWNLCREIFTKLEMSTALGQAQAPVEPLRVTAPSLFGTYMVLPFIKIFEKRHAGLKVIPMITDRVVDLKQEGIDIAIRWKLSKNVKLGDKVLRQVPFGFIASKSYLTQNAPIKSAEDLNRNTLIAYGEQHILVTQWQALLPKKQRHLPKKLLIIDNSLAQLEAVVQGFGLAILPVTVLKFPQYQKKLQAVLPQHHYQVGIYGCVATHRHTPERQTLFLNEFKAYLSEIGG